ncbi:Ribosome biogenesis protein ENP2, partial [Stagonosporopsis vannaccii]
GGVHAGAVNTAAVAEHSHNLLAFGTSLGTVEFWDSRSRNRVGVLSAPRDAFEGRAEVTALSFPRSGLSLAVGGSTGLIHLYDLRSPSPLLKKDQGYGFAIKNIIHLESASASRGRVTEPKILTADKRIIKLWDPTTGAPWTSVEPAVDLNHVEWVPDSGMLLTANEGKQQHSFFIPQLGPAPKWCAFLDNIVEEMAEDPNDPGAFAAGATGDVYDNFKFLTPAQLKTLNLDHLIGTTSLLRPYMHGYFVAQKLYEEAKLISNPDMWQEQRQKSIADKINKERESRIRGSKKVSVKVNQALAARMQAKEEERERRRARRVLKKGGDDDMLDAAAAAVQAPEQPAGLLGDSRFARLFQDEDFQVDEQSHEFQAINPSTKIPKGLTAAEQEDLESRRGSDTSDTDERSDSDAPAERPARKPRAPADARISSSSYRKAGHNNPMLASQNHKPPQMVVSHSAARKGGPKADKSFGARVSKLKERAPKSSTTTVVGEREITFAPEPKRKQPQPGDAGPRHDRRREKNIRSASGNAFRGM